MHYKASIVLFLIVCCWSFVGAAKKADELPLVEIITKDGVTWKFEAPVRAGQFVTGDYYVVGKATVVSITPAPANGRNGSVLNPPLQQISGYDDRVDGNRFRENLRVYPPVELSPGDQLLSSISVGENEHKNLQRWLREGTSDRATSPVSGISILTCLEQPVEPDAFRPSYGDKDKKIYYARDIKRDLLPKLEGVANIPDVNTFAKHFARPWVDMCQFSFDAPIAYMPDYGREIARAVGMASLILMLKDLPSEPGEKLMIGLVQYGIDIWGMARNGHYGWPAHGGHGSGRKWAIIFAGLLLGDDEMAHPDRSYPDLKFGEDMHTMYDDGWTGAKVVYAGHQGVFKGKIVSSTEGWGPYEHLHPSGWPGNLGENYRRCCTSLSWIGEALAARLMRATENWNHQPFFDYCDRWMTEDDSEHVEAILEAKGWNYSANWQRQRQTWDLFVNQMWEKYRYANAGIQKRESRDMKSKSGLSGQRGLLFPGNREAMYSSLKHILIGHSGIDLYSLTGRKLARVTPDVLSGDLDNLFISADGIYIWDTKSIAR